MWTPLPPIVADTCFPFAAGKFTGVGVIIFNRRLFQGFLFLKNPDRQVQCFDFQLLGRRYRWINVYAPTQRNLNNAVFLSTACACSTLEPAPLLTDGVNCVLYAFRDVQGAGYGRYT